MSSMRFAIEDLPVHLREQAQNKLASLGTISIVRDGKKQPGRLPPKVQQFSNKTKYNARQMRANGVTFDSKAEYHAYLGLARRESAGEIQNLRCHIRFSLFDPGGACRGEHIGTYRADFVYTEQGKLVVADKKSPPTRARRDWPRTKAMMRACHNIEVLEL